jgi:hypothetical protein
MSTAREVRARAFSAVKRAVFNLFTNKHLLKFKLRGRNEVEQ